MDYGTLSAGITGPVLHLELVQGDTRECGLVNYAEIMSKRDQLSAPGGPAGGVLMAPPGDYRIDGEILLYTPIKIRGCGRREGMLLENGPWGGTAFYRPYSQVEPIFTHVGVGAAQGGLEDLCLTDKLIDVPSLEQYAKKHLACGWMVYGGLIYNNIGFYRSVRGLNIEGCGRTHIDNIYSDMLINTVQMHRCYDTCYIGTIHHWPFSIRELNNPALGADSNRRMQRYMQDNHTLLSLGRVDGLFVNNLFCWASRVVGYFAFSSPNDHENQPSSEHNGSSKHFFQNIYGDQCSIGMSIQQSQVSVTVDNFIFQSQKHIINPGEVGYHTWSAPIIINGGITESPTNPNPTYGCDIHVRSMRCEMQNTSVAQMYCKNSRIHIGHLELDRMNMSNSPNWHVVEGVESNYFSVGAQIQERNCPGTRQLKSGGLSASVAGQTWY